MSYRSMRLATNRWLGMTLIVVAAALVGCGPSPEEQAATADAQTASADAQTATAATSTPTITPTFTSTPTNTPTPTPTPIPYDLSVLVRGEEDSPIVGASVGLAEVGQEAVTQTTDDVGQAFWYDLPGDPVNLSISAPGYFPLVRAETIERGINEVTIALERDPHGLLPSQACAPGERLLYIEDFQDGEAQGWEAIEFRAQGWDVAPHPDLPGNIVALRPGTGEGTADLRDHPLHNAVWRVRFSNHGRLETWFRWQIGGGYDVDGVQVDYSTYIVQMNSQNNGLIIVGRTQTPISDFTLYQVGRTLRRDVWHTLEISTYEDLIEIWIDGSRIMTYQDPKPLPGSVLGLVVGETNDAESVAYFDDISICELSRLFVPRPTPEP